MSVVTFKHGAYCDNRNSDNVVPEELFNRLSVACIVADPLSRFSVDEFDIKAHKPTMMQAQILRAVIRETGSRLFADSNKLYAAIDDLYGRLILVGIKENAPNVAGLKRFNFGAVPVKAYGVSLAVSQSPDDSIEFDELGIQIG